MDKAPIRARDLAKAYRVGDNLIRAPDGDVLAEVMAAQEASNRVLHSCSRWWPPCRWWSAASVS